MIERIEPTTEDLARDLVADLRIACSQDYGTGLADDAWPAAIRRALAAEREARGLQRSLKTLEEAVVLFLHGERTVEQLRNALADSRIVDDQP